MAISLPLRPNERRRTTHNDVLHACRLPHALCVSDRVRAAGRFARSASPATPSRADHPATPLRSPCGEGDGRKGAPEPRMATLTLPAVETPGAWSGQHAPAIPARCARIPLLRSGSRTPRSVTSPDWGALIVGQESG